MSGLQPKYFVLEPKGNRRCHKASRAALTAYARVIKKEDPALAKALREWVFDEIANKIDSDQG